MTETLNLMQWNIGLTREDEEDIVTSRLKVLESLIEEYTPSIFAIQEADHKDIKDSIPQEEYNFHISDGKVTAYDNDYWYTPSHKFQSPQYIGLVFEHIGPEGDGVLFVNIHAKSQLRGGRGSPEGSLSNLQNDLYAARSKEGYSLEEVVMGDYNVNPYNDCLISKDLLSAHRSLPNVKTQTKTRPIDKRPLYNPTWHFFGRHDGALGTHYYSTPQYGSPWAVFDQVMVTDGLAYDGEAAVELVTEVGQHRLVKDPPKYIPNEEVGSDHLPVVAKIHYETGISTD
ncbi:endonuclease/exonuclease/phosphatase family protein [Salinibacter ruber]|uniref:Endonuclease/exonuclease/phosphatase domain-containing protein n=1 Tax=Salinibacter ruber TaxID=146919 RepID=A0A9X2TJ21_9BACT|nr:endonuclease/exonuclease/phosphatase family protein [Salinibacter ruber]MCS3659908.1 hypothetical protein [Salinibacter ruber]MCS3709949.1 hypothetical protein [Salinibacter ruber]MCS4170225.1 hypothetical protein [Salinibacter ruber]